MILKGFLHVFGKIEKVFVKCQKHKTLLSKQSICCFE